MLGYPLTFVKAESFMSNKDPHMVFALNVKVYELSRPVELVSFRKYMLG